MTSISSATQALLGEIHWSAPAAPVRWSTVEKAVGVRYPSEFREVADALPPGTFQTFLTLLHPSLHNPKKYVTEIRGYAGMLESEAEARGFPYPVYPQRGGVLPWAIIGFDYIICWLTGDDEPDAWPVVLCDSHLSWWQVYQLSTAEFLRAVLSIPTPIERLSYVAEARQPPSFVGVDGNKSDSTGPDETYWTREAEGRDLVEPRDCVGQLRDLVASTPISVPDWYEVWMQVQGNLGWPPPKDYQHLVEELGAVAVGAVTVAVPGGPVDLLATYNKLRRKVLRQRRIGEGPAGTVWPEPHGVLRWADVEGGGHVCWLAVTDDPADWPVIVLDAELRHSALHMMTASRFLLEVATNPAGVVLKPPGLARVIRGDRQLVGLAGV
jgi:hypothetical protein